MRRPDFRDYQGGTFVIVHSAKGSTWKKGHKYVKKVNGKYYYKKDDKSKPKKSDSEDTESIIEKRYNEDKAKAKYWKLMPFDSSVEYRYQKPSVKNMFDSEANRRATYKYDKSNIRGRRVITPYAAQEKADKYRNSVVNIAINSEKKAREKKKVLDAYKGAGEYVLKKTGIKKKSSTSSSKPKGWKSKEYQQEVAANSRKNVYAPKTKKEKKMQESELSGKISRTMEKGKIIERKKKKEKIQRRSGVKRSGR